MNEKMEESIIGTIYLGERLGYCDITIHPYEKELHPHFHLKSKIIDFESCIGIYEPLYYNHDNINGVLTNNECILLYNEYIKERSGTSYGIDARVLWIGKNGDKYCPDLSPYPDYTKLYLHL